MKVCFEAMIKQITIRSLVSMDKQARLLLEFNASDDELIANINKLHKADETVKITIEEVRLNRKKDVILENEISIADLKIDIPEEEIRATRENPNA